MTARFEDGSQAGTFFWESERIMQTPDIDKQVQYVQHSGQGTQPTGERRVSWTLIWQAPQAGYAEPVVFNMAANAGNHDYSVFGDWIYVKEIRLEPKL